MLLITVNNICWAAFWLYWLISAFGAKRAARGPRWSTQIFIRIIAAVVIFDIARATHGGRTLYNSTIGAYLFQNPVPHVIGLLLFFTGLAFAIWARVYIGRNWGVPMSLRQDHELVTSGPYRYVRHPIYSGIILAAIGSILVGELVWAILLPWFLIYFLYSAFTEEKTMTEQFPSTYSDYKKQSKMLIPFLL